MSKNLKDYRIKFLLENYRSLREEILESIRLQSRIIMGEAIAVGIILGFGLTETTYRVLIIAIPFIITILNSWWIVEQSRMMRAGDFMQFLEDRINLEVGEPYVVWENWLRRKTDEKNDLGCIQKIKEWVNPEDPHGIHHIAQYLCILGVFYSVGIATIFFLYLYPALLNIPPFVSYGLAIFYTIIFGYSLILIRKIILHQGSKAKKEDFYGWLGGYWTKTKSMWEEKHESTDD